MPNNTTEAKRLFVSPALSVGPAGQVLTVSGNSPGLIDLRLVQDVTLMVNVIGAPGGTTPTLVVGLDFADPFGNFVAQAIKTASLNAAGAVAVSGGLHISPGLVLPEFGRISWTLGGTTPSFAVQITLIGR